MNKNNVNKSDDDRFCHDVGIGNKFKCSKCGCTLDLENEVGEATIWKDGMAIVPAYCVACGREVNG